VEEATKKRYDYSLVIELRTGGILLYTVSAANLSAVREGMYSPKARWLIFDSLEGAEVHLDLTNIIRVEARRKE
jgi:hypothetical protein